jgi:hypothetical protein
MLRRKVLALITSIFFYYFPDGRTLYTESVSNNTKESDNVKEKEEAAASRPETPSKADGDSIVKVKRSLTESQGAEPDVPAKVIKI